MTADVTPSDAKPVFSVVRGQPADDELAAVIAVLSAVSASADIDPSNRDDRRSRWSDPAASLRQPMTPGPRAWWGSALPR
jgi:hypothetical protein